MANKGQVSTNIHCVIWYSLSNMYLGWLQMSEAQWKELKQQRICKLYNQGQVGWLPSGPNCRPLSISSAWLHPSGRPFPCAEQDGEPPAPGSPGTHGLLDGSSTETQEGSDWLSLSHMTTLRQERECQSHGKHRDRPPPEKEMLFPEGDKYS